ncbi:ACT domain-containing protein [Talaromyces proteolyticus]|uniref:ACT domain-containing protein n=1 Tax=Talaromyces proteolyticus TaxID=1131652 RepID=A0AAD4KVP6_9EURO|nr:ACT domain-containing protein [Talaromyces proteolyticus]KAH8702087.1 ACT domain-containing protein [Talaromyces proteolyticus]
MDQSISLISATVQMTDSGLALVHIPLDLYPFFVQPLLRLLFCDIPAIDELSKEDQEDAERASQTPFNLGFVNLSLTPVEASVVCSRQLAERYFVPLATSLNKITSSDKQVSVSKDDYLAMQVEGQGLDAGRRVLELTGPLALAGISIFFISTYFSDYILVPLRSKDQVVRTLTKQGFAFETDSDQFLQTRTFDYLRKNKIIPRVDQSIRLVQCCAHHRDGATESSAAILRAALTTALLVDHPRFLSLTLTPADPAASLLLEKRLLPRFTLDPSIQSDDEERSILLGSKEDILIPITLDLRDVPIDATGIVCGVAGRLADATEHRDPLATLSTNSSPANDSKRFSFGSVNIDDLRLSESISSLAPSTSSGAKKSESGYSNVPASATDNLTKNNTFTSSIYDRRFSRDSNVSGVLPATATIPHHRLEPEQYGDAVEISFLSTARAGTVLVWEREIGRAVEALDAEKSQHVISELETHEES